MIFLALVNNPTCRIAEFFLAVFALDRLASGVSAFSNGSHLEILVSCCTSILLMVSGEKQNGLVKAFVAPRTQWLSSGSGNLELEVSIVLCIGDQL